MALPFVRVLFILMMALAFVGCGQRDRLDVYGRVVERYDTEMEAASTIDIPAEYSEPRDVRLAYMFREVHEALYEHLEELMEGNPDIDGGLEQLLDELRGTYSRIAQVHADTLTGKGTSAESSIGRLMGKKTLILDGMRQNRSAEAILESLRAEGYLNDRGADRVSGGRNGGRNGVGYRFLTRAS